VVQVQKPNLTDAEIHYAIKKLGREPNEVEWAMLEAQWSEHCSYKSSKPLLKLLPIKGRRVLIGPGFDAGAIDLGNGWVATLHIESHNHPSAIDPYGGAATGVGGVVRDILSMGTRPIALLDPLRFGNLESSHSRWLFDNVVRGIGDYGNCLSGEELVYFTNSDEFHISDVESLFKDYENNGKCSIEFYDGKTRILRPKVDIRVLSFDFQRNKASFGRVSRIYRTRTLKLLNIQTGLGRVISVTPDHPMFVINDGNVSLKRASDLVIGDTVPLVCDFPSQADRPKSYDIDLITELVRRGQIGRIGVRPSQNKLVTLKEHLLPLFRKAGVGSAQWCYYFRRGRGSYLPLKLYLKLESSATEFLLPRRDVLLHSGRGRVNPIPAIIGIDSEFARLVGYFLAEGCRHDEKGANTSRLIWTFRNDENEYIDDVCSILKRIGIRYSKRQSSPSAVQIKVSSNILGFVFREVLDCGKDSYSMHIPSLFFRLHRDLLNELLKGIIRGDGSLRADSSSPVGIRYATTSSLLFEQVLLLLQSLGYLASSSTGYKKKSKVPIHELEIHGAEQVDSLKNLFSSQLVSKAKRRLEEYRFPKLARQKFKRYQSFAGVRVTKIEEVSGDFRVYNFEVDGTHNYVSTGGLITHNCIGVPTVGGEVEFDPSFERNCLVDVVCLGLGRKNKLVLAEALHPGDRVYIIGGSTGRDGIRGASFASKTLTEKSDSERSAVQVPDPFTKKLMIEAVLEAVEAGLVRGMKDLGGGGLTCGLSEMASKGGTGMEINLDNLRTRESDMASSEIMISESQERMILIVQPSDEQKLKKILDKWDLGYSHIGQVTRDGLLVIKRGQGLVARAPAKFVAEAPLTPRLSRKPSYIDELQKAPTPHAPEDYNETLLSLLASPNICSREWIYQQYDFEVGLKTMVKPGEGDSAILRLPNGRTLVISTDGNSKLVYLDPYWGTINILSESLSNLVVSGAEPVAVVDHLQYGDPGNPEVYWTFKEAIMAIRDYLTAVRVPCIGGKVSFYNEDSETRTAIKPSPVIAALGLRDSRTPKIGAALKNEGDDLLIVGTTFPELGGSEYYETIQGVVGGAVPKVNLTTERTTMRGVAATIKSGFVEAAHDISRGGLAIAIAEMAILGKRGCSIELSAIPKKTRTSDQLLFSESRPRFILESKPKYTSRIMTRLKAARIKASKIGQVQNDRIVITRDSEPMISVPLQVATDSWSETLRKSMEVTP
jgi:phosphoribosylformylglycinamidine synthase